MQQNAAKCSKMHSGDKAPAASQGQKSAQKVPEICGFSRFPGLGGGRWIRTTEGIASRFTAGRKAAYLAAFLP